MDSKDSGKVFANNLIDTAATVVLGSAVTHVTQRIDRRGAKLDFPKFDLDNNYFAMHELCLGFSSAFILSLHSWGILPVLK